jgi:hypothetical protein
MSNARNLANLLGTGTQITTADIADGAFQANKNLIINGAMQVWQRTTAATSAGNTYATVDRFAFGVNTDGAYTTEQSTDTPTGTGYSLKAQVTTADTSISSGQYAYMYHEIEAQNLQHLLYGTSAAKSITLSFWVKSNKTGIYTIILRKLPGTDCHLVYEYTIDSANTWEKKEITISPTAGSTSIITSSTGAISNDNGRGIQLGWNFAFGSNYNGATNNTWTTNTNHYATSNQVNWMDSTSNNFYLAEVQLEVGDTATPFEHRSYGDELARCQRYYAYLTSFVGPALNSSVIQPTGIFPKQMRSSPTYGTTGVINISDNYAADYTQSSANISVIANNTDGSPAQFLKLENFSGLNTGRMYFFPRNNANNNRITLDSEL